MAPVLEILHLVAPDKTPIANNPRILSALRGVRRNLQAGVHDTDSRFYRQADRPEHVYVFGQWESVAQHAAFTRSPARAEVLGPQEGVLGFVDVVHVRLAEGGIGGLLDGRGAVRLGWGVVVGGSSGGGGGGKGGEGKEGLVELKRCDEGFEQEVYVFDFSGNGDIGGADGRYRLAGQVELLDLESS